MENKRVSRSISSQLDNFSTAILVLWCLMPVAVFIFILFHAVLGHFPTQAELEAAGYPIGHLNYDNVRDAGYMLFRVLGVLTLIYDAFALVLIRPRVKKMLRSALWYVLLLALMLWAIVCTLLCGDPVQGFKGGTYMRDGLSSYFVFAGVFVCAATLRTEGQRRLVLRLYSGVTCFLALLMIVQEWTRNPFLDYCFPSYRAVTFNQFNHFGYILSMGTLALAGLYLHDRRGDGRFRFVYLAGFGLLVYAVLINDSFGAFVAILAALPVAYTFYIRHGGKCSLGAAMPALVFVAVVAAYALGLAPNSHTVADNFAQFGTDISNIASGAEAAATAGTGRMTLWRETLTRISQRPIFGFGPEGFYGDYAIENNESPHNEYLQIAGYLGIPGLLMYLGALVTLARDHWKRIRALSPMVLAVSGVTVAYLISACFGNPVFNTAPCFWMFLGMTTADGVNPPLLSIDPELAEARLSAKSSRRRVGILIGTGAALLAGILGGSLYLTRQTERANEAADLQCMRGAESVGLLGLRSGNAQAGETYWFDANAYALIPISEPAPQPYGMGTARQGGALEQFSQEFDLHYSYDEATDYREMVIKIDIQEGADGKPQIELNWVSPS